MTHLVSYQYIYIYIHGFLPHIYTHIYVQGSGFLNARSFEELLAPLIRGTCILFKADQSGYFTILYLSN